MRRLVVALVELVPVVVIVVRVLMRLMVLGRTEAVRQRNSALEPVAEPRPLRALARQ